MSVPFVLHRFDMFIMCIITDCQGGLLYVNIENLQYVLNPVEEGATAAVALLLKVDCTVEVLFVKRVENPNDLWSGQMALPGGKRDAKDKTITETMIRETAEETGITLDSCQILGALNPIETTLKSDMKILPFVVLLEYEPVITLNKRELEAFVWISLEDLERNRGTVTFPFGEFPAYIVGEYVIWGMTYRILEDFFHTIELSDIKK